jgi:Protein of unknown function (DUF3341)
MHKVEEKPPIYGIMAEFDNVDAVVIATRKAYSAGYRKMDAYSPYPVEELWEALGFHRTRLPNIVFGGAMFGLFAGYSLQYFVSAIEYPLIVGGRPFHSWVSFIPVSFETTILFAAITTVLGMLLLNGLPMPYHPVFNVPGFSRATTDRFFLCIEATDPKFDRAKTAEFLKSFNPREVTEVAH